MFEKPSILTRVAVGKLTSFVIGTGEFFVLPAFGVEDLRLRVGLVLWYVVVGAAIALAGVFRRTPILDIPTPWWLLGPGVGASFNLALTLIAWDLFVALMADGRFVGLTSPWWLVAEGAVVGLVIAGVATWLGGDGPQTVRSLERTSYGA